MTSVWRSRMLVPLVAGLANAAVSFVAITTPSVWFDEAATVSGATRSIPELLHMLGKVDAVHGLYYMLMHVAFGATGYTPLSLRRQRVCCRCHGSSCRRARPAVASGFDGHRR